MLAPALAALAATSDGIPVADPLVVFEQACMRGEIRLKKSVANEVTAEDMPALDKRQARALANAHYYRMSGISGSFYLSVGETREANGALGRRMCRVIAEGVKLQDGYDAVMYAGSLVPRTRIDKAPSTVRTFERISTQGYAVSLDATSRRWTILQSTQLGPAKAAEQADAFTNCKKDMATCQLLRDESRKH